MIDLPKLPNRAADAHKGDFGRALIVGGCVGMSGAAVLAGMAALRSGAGLVQVAVPKGVWAITAQALPAALVTPLRESTEGGVSTDATDLEPILKAATSVAIGPGLGMSDGARRTLTTFVEMVRVPCVYDADALNLLARAALQVRRFPKNSIVTPHPGEMARLLGRTREEIQAKRKESAIDFAKAHPGLVVVLKGAGTIVTDGERVAVNTTGGHGLARGGSGDILAGIIAALLAQQMTTFDAAVLGVYAHGMAGDIVQEAIGARGMTAEDVVRALPSVWKRLEGR